MNPSTPNNSGDNKQVCYVNRYSVIVDQFGHPIDRSLCSVVYAYEPPTMPGGVAPLPPLFVGGVSGNVGVDTPPMPPPGVPYDQSADPVITECVRCLSDCEAKVKAHIYANITECTDTCQVCGQAVIDAIGECLDSVDATLDKCYRKVMSHIATSSNIADSYASLVSDEAWSRVLSHPEPPPPPKPGEGPIRPPTIPVDWTCVSTDPTEFTVDNPEGCRWDGECWWCPPIDTNPVVPPLQPVPLPGPEPSPPYNPYPPPYNPPPGGPVNPPPPGGPVNPPAPCPPPPINIPPCPPFPPINIPVQPPCPPPIIQIFPPPCPGGPPNGPPADNPPIIVVPPPVNVPPPVFPPPVLPPKPPTPIPPPPTPTPPPPTPTPPCPEPTPCPEPPPCPPIVFSYECKDKIRVQESYLLKQQLMLSVSSFPTAGIDSLT